MTEEWRTIVRAPDYEVSSLGRIRRVKGGMGAKPGRILKASVQDGYLVVMVPPSKRRSAFVHVLVAEAFHGPRPEGCDALHRNGVRSDARASNIYWGAPLQNAADREAHGNTARGEACGAAKTSADVVKEIRQFVTSNTISAASLKFGISRSQIHRIKHSQSWRHVE